MLFSVLYLLFSVGVCLFFLRQLFRGDKRYRFAYALGLMAYLYVATGKHVNDFYFRYQQQSAEGCMLSYREVHTGKGRYQRYLDAVVDGELRVFQYQQSYSNAFISTTWVERCVRIVYFNDFDGSDLILDVIPSSSEQSNRCRCCETVFSQTPD